MSTQAIPPMAHELGRYWEQPPTDDIQIDDTHALMSQRTFCQLHEYSTSMPSGVYEGKMWRRGEPWNAPRKWFLGWYGTCDEPNMVSNNWREIIICE